MFSPQVWITFGALTTSSLAGYNEPGTPIPSFPFQTGIFSPILNAEKGLAYPENMINYALH
jgi:hypothetical protein